jgi:3-oxoacyl-[acyl-carrier-protein] synthase II
MTSSPHLRRVVVTGVGLVTPLGTGPRLPWQRLLEGRIAISHLEDAAYATVPARVAGLVQYGQGEGEFDLEHWVDKSIRSHTSRFIHFGLSAAEQALEDAGWRPSTDEEEERTGVAIGTGCGGMDAFATANNLFETKGVRSISPYSMPMTLSNLAAGHVSIQHKLRGPLHCTSTACASGTNAIGDAYRFIQFGDADVMVAGASEACISPVTAAMFTRSRSLATAFNDEPLRASRPFDRDRAGFVMAEGAACLVLEELGHAQRWAYLFFPLLFC